MYLSARYLLQAPDAPLLEDHALRIEEGRVTALAPRGALGPRSGEECLDLGDSLVMPGLSLAHTHLDYGVYRGHGDGLPFLPWVRALAARKRAEPGPEAFLRGARLGCLELVAAGVVAVGENTDPGVPAARALVESGLRGVCFQEEFLVGPGSPDKILAGYREKLTALEAVTSGSRVRVAVSPHSCYLVPPALFQGMAAEARKRGVGLSIHVAEFPEEVELIRHGRGPLAAFQAEAGETPPAHGVSPLAYLAGQGWLDGHPRVLVVHGVLLEPGDLEELAGREDAWLVHCPRSNARLGEGIAPVPEALGAGVQVCLGSDGACSADRLDPFEEMRAALWLARAGRGRADALSGEEVLGMALAGSRALGFGPGRLEEGAPADLCALSLDSPALTPLRPDATGIVLQGASSDVCATMVAGELLYLRGDFLRVDAREILEEARAGARQMLPPDPATPG